MPRILLIDDEPAITESLAYALSRAGFETLAARTIAEADAALGEVAVDLVILDLVLPDGNGLEWLKGLRTRSKLPVIILSSHDEAVDHIVGLEVGADDYVDKPFSPREVAARVRAVLRRATPEAESPTPSSAPLVVDLEARQAYAHGTLLALSKTEFDLLAALYQAPGRVFERDALLDRVWGDVAVTERSVDAFIKALRRKLADCGVSPDLIETVRGVGYRLARDCTAPRVTPP